MTDRTETLAERRLRQANEGRAAMTEFLEKKKQVDERTARLRALRLKKEAVEAAEAKTAKPAKTAKAGRAVKADKTAPAVPAAKAKTAKTATRAAPKKTPAARRAGTAPAQAASSSPSR